MDFHECLKNVEICPRFLEHIHLLLQNQNQLVTIMYSKNTSSFQFLSACIFIGLCYNFQDIQQSLFLYWEQFSSVRCFQDLCVQMLFLLSMPVLHALFFKPKLRGIYHRLCSPGNRGFLFSLRGIQDDRCDLTYFSIDLTQITHQ